MEKDFLQSLKLEISRTFTLAPYERIAFHKVLGFQKSENGLHILLRDLQKQGLVRRSAVSVLKEWANPEITIAFLDLLVTNDTIASDEFFNIIDHIEKFGKTEHSQPLMEYIGKFLEKTEFVDQTCRTVFTLGQIGFEKKEVLDFLKSIITNPAMFERVRCAAIESFIHTADIATMEAVLHENNDRLTYAVYRALAGIADREMIKYEVSAGDDLFTVMPGQDDRVLLDIRVLLGKMSPSFDGYSRETKAAYIMAMILCSHREFIVYTMKALTSNDPALIDLTLYVILSHTDKLRLPDKLFRSLTGLPSVTMRDSEIIIEIFHRFFSRLKESRNNMLFRDKIYNYLIVTLDTFFEEYRKNFMIPEIMEKNHLPEIQEIRRLVLNRFSPDLKKRIVSYFRNEDAVDINKIIGAISESVPFIPDDENDSFAKFIEMLSEKDKKMREICASRIDDIDYEKRYLKNRIVRICGIIGRLQIGIR